MNTEDGSIMPWAEVEKLNPEIKEKWKLITRELTEVERLTKQIELYSPCGCGSDEKFKFCCHKSK